MVEGQPKVSVIIPVYNAEKYLAECLDSLTNQSLRNIEIICVDDGSTDRSPEILKKYELQDSRIKIYKQSNQYAGVARNNGLKVARGEYVIFLDSDDCFHSDMLRLSYAKAIKTDADIVIFDAQRFDTVTGNKELNYHYLKIHALPKEDVFNSESVPDSIFQITTPAPWNKLFRRSFIQMKDIEFQSLLNSNDVFFVMTALSLAEKIAVIRKPLLYYRTNSGTSLQSTKNRDSNCFIKAFQAVYERLIKEKKWDSLKKSFANAVVSSAVYNLETQNDSYTESRIKEGLFGISFRKTEYLNQAFSDYEYPEKAFKLRLALAEYTTECISDYQKEAKKNRENHSNKPTVSVIIPVYNTATYLEMSIGSILKQTLTNIEVICVDDGSTDDSKEVLEQLAKTDKRIRVLTQVNGGQSAARNHGLMYACGEYVYFFDSDDKLKPHALKRLYAEAKLKQLDILLFDGESQYMNSELHNRHGEFNDYYHRQYSYDQVLSGEELYTLLRKNNEYRCSVCLQFVKLSFLRHTGISFLHGIPHEDELYSLQLHLKANRASHINDILFIRSVRDNSTMTSAKSIMNCYAYFRVAIETMKWIESEQLTLKKETENIIANWLKYLIQKTRQMYLELPYPQKCCVNALPIGQRILFETIVMQQGVTQSQITNILHNQVSLVQEPQGIGRVIKGIARKILPRRFKTFVKGQFLRIPHKTKVKIKRLIHW